MIRVLSISRIVTIIAVVYAILVVVCSTVISQFGEEAWEAGRLIKFALSGAAVLEGVLMVGMNFGWRWLWQCVPALNRWVYPDIGGEWKITINWWGEGEEGIVDAKAIIRQDLLRMSMEVRSDKSESGTLIAEPRKDQESGTPFLYYVYLVTPKLTDEKAGSPYFGAARLKFFEGKGEELSGNYWTSKQTSGHFRLSRQAE